MGGGTHERRWGRMLNGWQKQKLLKRRFTLPNELFSLELNSAEISIYTYLLYLENRKTHQCWPSYRTSNSHELPQ